MNIPRLVRWSSGIALVLLLGGLGGMAGWRLREKSSRERVDRNPLAESQQRTSLGINKNFKYLERINGQLIFTLDALQTLGKKSGWNDIEGITLHYGNSRNPGPILTCQRAKFNSRTKEARLSGSIHVQFPDGSFLSTEAGSLEQGGNTFATNAQVTFVNNDLIGTAARARFQLKKALLILSGGVVVQTADGNSMKAPRVEYFQKDRKIKLPDGAHFSYGPLQLTAGAGSITLAEEASIPDALRLSQDVSIEMDDINSGRILHASSKTFDAVRDAEGNWQVDARSTAGWVKFELIGGENSLAQTIMSWRIKAVYGSEGLLSVKSSGRTCFQIIPYVGPSRRGESLSARVWFSGGEASNIELQDQVSLQEEKLRVLAKNARIDVSSGRVMLQGDPTGQSRVSMISDQGRVQADSAILFQAKMEVELHGRVQGEQYDIALMGSAAKSGSREGESLHIAADSLRISENGEVYELGGEARAWQGDKLLVADRILYHPTERKLHAKGHVRTTFPAAFLDPRAKGTEDVVLVSRVMDFSEADGLARYQGQVVFTGPQYLLSAGDLRIELSPNGDEVERVIATGAVEMKDLQRGQSLSGTHVIRDMKTAVVEVQGSPARATDSLENMLSGRTLTFSEADGSVSVAEETETIYHSEETESEPKKP